MQKLKKALNSIEEGLIAYLLLISTIILFVNVIMRYVFTNSTTWAEEVIRYSIIWVTFIGSNTCIRNKLHVGIDIVVNSVNKKLNKILLVCIDIVCIIFSIFLCMAGYENTMLVMQTAQKTPALMMSMWIVYASIAIGGALMIISYIFEILNTIKGNKNDDKDNLDISKM